MRRKQSYRALVESLSKLDTQELVKLPMDEFVAKLVDKEQFFRSEVDLKLFILEYMVVSFQSGSDWPIRYYDSEEEFEEDIEECIDSEDEMLTDLYVQTTLDGSSTRAFNPNEKI